MTDLIKIEDEVKLQLSNKEVMSTLVATTFKGLNQNLIKQAIVEGHMRGYKFQDFLEKNVYAIPFGTNAYSLVTSIDYARKIGMRSGVVGTSAPEFEEKDGKIVSCTVTVKKKTDDHIGEYSAKVYFSEYSTGRGLWTSKPHTMISKVAEMHALRKACPEELSKAYTEDEMQEVTKAKPEINVDEFRAKLIAVKSLEELKTVWASLPVEAKKELEPLKDEMKQELSIAVTKEEKNENA